MDYESTKTTLDSIPADSIIFMVGTFDFPNRNTERRGKLVSYDQNGVTIDNIWGGRETWSYANFSSVRKYEESEGLQLHY
jgi:hypothetical protein